VLANFTYDRTGLPPVDRALDKVALAFRRVDQSTALNVVAINQGGNYQATGLEDLIVVNRPCTIVLPTPTVGWFVRVVMVSKGVVLITPASPTVALDGSTPGSIDLARPYETAEIASDGTAYYTVGGSAAAPVIPPIPPFPPVVPPGPVPPPATTVTPWFAPVAWSGTGPYNSSSGAETWAAESIVDFTQAPSLLTAWWWFESLSASGTATFRIRIGGTSQGALNGAVFAVFTETSSTLVPHTGQATGVAPAGMQRVTLSIQSSAATVDAKIGYINLQFR
jgi:hypothetical protein